MNDNDFQYDVLVVVGGGPAGLSGALTLSRTRCPTTALGARALPGGGFAVRTADGDEPTARRLLVTTGLTDVLPDIDGLAAHWGLEVFGCPFCHAWEVRDTRIGVLSTGPHDLFKAHLLRRWSDDVTLFLHTGPEPDDDQWAGFAARGISVVDGEVTGVHVEGDRFEGLRLASGTIVAADALAISPRAVAHAGLLADLGLAAAPHPSGLGDHVPSGPGGGTAVPGVWVAGNVTDPTAHVVTAAAAGTAAAGAITRELVEDEVTRALRPADPFTPESEAALATAVAGRRAHGLAR